jgi:hypothetical protein
MTATLAWSACARIATRFAASSGLSMALFSTSPVSPPVQHASTERDAPSCIVGDRRDRCVKPADGSVIRQRLDLTPDLTPTSRRAQATRTQGGDCGPSD